MYHGKHIRKSKRPVALLASLVMLLAVAVVGTAAFLTTQTNEVKNTFTPAQVPNKVEETFNGSTKSNVKIQNTGDVKAYIRVALIATWVNDQGEVYGEKPVECKCTGSCSGKCDYSMSWTKEGWVEKDGYYYYTSPVAKDGKTGELFTACQPINLKDGKSPNQPEGYVLSIEILSQSIQADGVDEKGNKPIALAWGVDIPRVGQVVKATIKQ